MASLWLYDLEKNDSNLWVPVYVSHQCTGVEYISIYEAY